MRCRRLLRDLHEVLVHPARLHVEPVVLVKVLRALRLVLLARLPVQLRRAWVHLESLVVVAALLRFAGQLRLA